MKKKYTSEFKAKIVLEVLREAHSLSEISSREGIHPNMIGRWRNEVTENLHTIFEAGRRKVEQEKAQNETIQELYGVIGELTTKLNWLKKKSGIEI